MFHTHKKSLLIFLVVGALAMLVNLSIFSVLWEYVHLKYLLAVAIAYIIAVLFHFSLNRRYTFRAYQKNMFVQLPKYVVMIGINLGLSLIVADFCVRILKLSPYLGVILSIGATTGLGYMLSRYWVFKVEK
jgi:putative flippase GtrA